MKFNLKMIAAAVAMVSAAGAANAALSAASTGNGSTVLYAFNTVTRDFYIRDLGFLMNDFLPSSVTSLSGNGGGTGTRTPEAGVQLNAGNTTNFSDVSFSAWLAGQTASDVRWAFSAADATGTSTATNVPRAITSSAIDLNPTNGIMSNYTSSGNAGGFAVLFGDATLSATGAGAGSAWDTNFGFGAGSLASLNSSVGLYYFARTTGTASTAAAATKVQYGNSGGFASVTLESDGDFVYNLAAAPVLETPIPAAAWLLGSGLIGLGGMARRRKAAAQA